MSLEDRLLKMPLVSGAIRLCDKILLPGFEGLSLYDLIKTYGVGIVKGTFSSRAGGIAFSFFMAIFPFLLFVLNLIPYIPIENFQERFLDFIGEIMPAQTFDFFFPVIEDIAANPRGGLLSFVFVLTLLLMANGVNSIFSGFEYSFHVNINRKFFRQYWVALVVSVFLALLLLFTVVIAVYSEYVVSMLKQEDYITDEVFWIQAVRYVVFVLLVYMVVAILYYYGVKDGREGRFFSIGALVTTVLFMITTWLFGVYINNFSNYNELYGSIGALLIMMLYIWLNSNLLLLGFELNASLRTLKNKH